MRDYSRNWGELALATVPSPPSPEKLSGRISRAAAVAGCSVAHTSLKAAPAVCAYVGGLSQQPVWQCMWEVGGKGLLKSSI